MRSFEPCAQPLEVAVPPKGGWLRAIRESLGMSAEQLGRRLGISKQSVLQLEENERRKVITLVSLERAASFLGCRLRYVLEPIEPLEAQVETRQLGLVKARRQMARVRTYSMGLEDQELSGEALERQVTGTGEADSRTSLDRSCGRNREACLSTGSDTA